MTRKELISHNRETLSAAQHILDINGLLTAIIINGTASFDVSVNGTIKAHYRTARSCKRFILKMSIEVLTKHIK